MTKKMTDEEFNRLAARPKKDCEIFVDMDGVLSDFDGHARAHGKFNPDGSTKWDQLDQNWWRTMPAYPGMKDFYESLRQITNTRILTAPVSSSGCYAGKAQWVEDMWPERGIFAILDLIICRAEDKQLLARPHHILIDDRQKNIDEWVKAGGIGILHKGDYAATLVQVKQAVAAIRAPKPRAPRPKKDI